MFDLKGRIILRLFLLVFAGVAVFWVSYGQYNLNTKILSLIIILSTIAWLELLLRAQTKIRQMTLLSITDELTGLYNDRYFYQLLEEHVGKDDSFGIVKIAIDNLIKYNEKYGYVKSDALIKKVARHLSKNINPVKGEKVFRYFGQFLVLLPRANPQEINAFVYSIKKLLEALVPPPGIPENQKIEVTFGRTYFPEDGRNAKELITALNESFEEAKEAKNREYEEYRRRSEKLAVVGQLAAGLAHEIRNPLTTVKGFCNLIKEKSREQITIEYINILLPELDRVCELVKEFLFLTKPAAPNLKSIYLQELGKATVTLMESEALLKDVELVNGISEDLPPIEGDFEQLKQVLINLVLNSIEAMPGKGSIILRGYQNVEKKVMIEIEDTGKGIDNEKIVKVFEPFYTTKEEGTGLGLSIANQIIQSHRGKMTIRSISGKGTTVAIELPMVA